MPIARRLAGNTLRLTAAAVAAVLWCGSAHAQCPHSWQAGGLSVAGVDGWANRSAVWDPDGPGPASPQLVIAGAFGMINGVAAPGLARWDGASWAPLPDPGFAVLAMASRPGQLLAGGRSAAGPTLSAWDGVQWTVVQTGEPAETSVFAVGVYQDEVYVGGTFSSFGGAGGRVARLTGGQWTALPGPFVAPHSMVVVGDDLVIGGAQQTAWWDGSAVTFHEMPGIVAWCYAEHAGDLYAGRYSFISSGLVFRWNGAEWELHGENIGPSFQQAWVFSLASYAGELYAGGDFVTFGPASGGGVARWRNGQWEAVGGYASSLAVYQGRLHASNYAGGLVSNLAAWDGASWSPVGIEPPTIKGSLTASRGRAATCGSAARSRWWTARARRAARWRAGAAGSGTSSRGSGGRSFPAR